MRTRISVISKTKTGRNERFYDHDAKESFSRRYFVKEIKQGKCPSHHIRVINGIETPCSNPDKSKLNNLG